LRRILKGNAFTDIYRQSRPIGGSLDTYSKRNAMWTVRDGVHGVLRVTDEVHQNFPHQILIDPQQEIVMSVDLCTISRSERRDNLAF
jgi:hypothetical protein